MVPKINDFESKTSELYPKIRNGCIITKADYPDIEEAHVYPSSLMKRHTVTKLSSEIPFFTVLRYWWTEKRVQAWQQQIFSRADDQTLAVESASNIVTLSKKLRVYWGGRRFHLGARPRRSIPRQKRLLGCALSSCRHHQREMAASRFIYIRIAPKKDEKKKKMKKKPTVKLRANKARVQLARESSIHNAGHPFWLAVKINQASALTIARTLNEIEDPA
ncbi:hypothetical protein BO82DRAFT_5933 [Aspergillus uvarum CBS 121591]|uniref:HNH nuclease domain-containing protein n=1 Tax=Aspergillus uvarum CBS 121591 TaxID=1448315 RepID=A0A319DGJ2_9EURO|nr:hypothetical protein BO82DRAFT_5933 [Aspergillus uvarum CBS 121591]PYH87248.1 hypothetical protein BO82DRAFT_5933 [Aspergillus uvarum CBS 121591]